MVVAVSSVHSLTIGLELSLSAYAAGDRCDWLGRSRTSRFYQKQAELSICNTRLAEQGEEAVQIHLEMVLTSWLH